MEHPRLGVEAGGAEVVGDADLGPEVGELVEGPALGRAGVGRGEDAERLALLAVAAQRVEQRAMPLRRMNAITTSIASADSISERSWLQRLGSPGALVSSVVSSSGMSGSSIVPRLPSGRRRRMACSTVAGSTGSADRSTSTSSPRRRAAPGRPCSPTSTRRRRRRRRAPARSAGSGARRSGRLPPPNVAHVAPRPWWLGQLLELRLETLGDEGLVEPGPQLLRHGGTLRGAYPTRGRTHREDRVHFVHDRPRAPPQDRR